MTGIVAIPFWVLASVAATLAVGGFAVAVLEDRYGDSRVAFDLVRSIAIIAVGWCAVACATVLDPIRMNAAVFVPPTVMATATFLNFLIELVGWGCFVVFRWQALHGRHPWSQREGA